MANIGLQFGLLAAPFVKQLREQKVRINDVKAVKRLDAASEALSRLTLLGILTERQRDAGRRKVMDQIIKHCSFHHLTATGEGADRNA